MTKSHPNSFLQNAGEEIVAEMARQKDKGSVNLGPWMTPDGDPNIVGTSTIPVFLC